jgi:hypothetical protein
VLELDAPGARAGDVLRELRVLNWWGPNEPLRVCGPAGKAIYKQRLLDGGGIAEEIASGGVCEGLSAESGSPTSSPRSASSGQP